MPKVLITGGSRGIGCAAAKCFLDEQWDVVILARDTSVCGLDVEKIDCDLADVEALPDIVASIGPVDVLVNNAGIIHNQGYGDDEYAEDQKKAILRINLEAPVMLMEECAKAMKQQKSGRIVNVTSVAAHTGHPDIWYGITKAGLTNATKSFARKLGPFGIVVTAVAPGPVETDMLQTIAKERIDDLRSKAINNEIATSEEIAEVIYWLATDAPNQLSGSTIDANHSAYPR